MPTMISGLGGSAGYGEQSFKTTGGYTGNLDDGSRLIDLTSVFGASGLNLYGTTYTSVYVNTNGLLTFNSPNPSYTPVQLNTLNQPSIAPFWTDVDISKGGDIYWDLDPTNGTFTVTWLNTRAYAASGLDSFQVVLTNQGGGNFSVDFIYQDINYTNGYTGNATVGFSNGSTMQTVLTGSNSASALANYANTDFQTDDPVGVFSLDFQNGIPFFGDGVIDGTVGDDLIDFSYLADPNGDRVDNNDARGYSGTTGNDDYIRGGAGNDTIHSGVGNDQVYGGTGNDSINAGTGNDIAYGGMGNDTIDGSSGNDTLYGDAGNDIIYGGAATTGTTYTPSYGTKVTSTSTAVTGTNGRSSFTVTTTSNDGSVDTGSSGSISGYRLGRYGSEINTHTSSSQLEGGQIKFNQINSDEALTIILDGVTIDLNAAIAAGYVTFDGGGAYSISSAGKIVRTGSAGTTNTIGTLTINVPFTSLGVGKTGATTSSAGFYYEFYPNTNPANILPEVGGNDVLYGGDGDDFLYGGDGDDSLSGDAGNDKLYGGTGNDTLIGGAGADVLDGGAGTDLASYAASTAGVSVNLTTGLGAGGDAAGDTLTGIENVTGSAFDDTLTGDSGANVLDGGAGNDLLDGGAGNDSLYGGAGNDTLIGGAGSDILDGGAGTDTASYATSTSGVSVNLSTGAASGGDAAGDTFISIENLTGSAFNDTLTGDSGANALDGGAGNDLLDGGAGNDSLYGGAGNDTLIGGAGSDVLDGGAGIDLASYAASTAGVSVNLATGLGAGGDAAGDTLTGIENVTGSAFNDTLTGDSGANALDGGAGNDLLDGGVGNDSLYGGSGNDTLIGGAGSDVLDGGAGIDLANYAASTAGVSVNLATGLGAGGDAAGDTLTGIENVTGSAFNDTLTGDSGANVLDGGAGNDLLDGGAGNDSLYGGAGNDTLIGGAGSDILDGGAGTDTASYATSTAGVSVNLATGAVSGGDAAGDTLISIENVTGSAFNDTLTGDSGANVLDGGAGNDLLNGGAGNDSLYGGAGNDTLIGGAGNDLLSGGTGEDVIYGGIGDTIDGGDGVDRLDVSGQGAVRIIYDAANRANGTVQFLNADRSVAGTLTFANIESVVACFTPGILIATRAGQVAVENLQVGDLVMTRDHGLQPIRWIGRRTISAQELRANPSLQPVLISQGALGEGLPLQDTLVSPQHKMLVESSVIGYLFGEDEVLVPAKHLIGLDGVELQSCSAVTYLHILFERHEVILSNGTWSESFMPGDQTEAGFDTEQRRELLTIFPQLQGKALGFIAARPSLKAYEARVLVSALRPQRMMA
jgi:Ca2+-binding RTX toxin-like protein